MSPALKECETAAMRLPVADRAALAGHLLESLDLLDDVENERLWIEESERRYQAYKAGLISARSVTDAIQDARVHIR
jgi:hypothetical protein